MEVQAQLKGAPPTKFLLMEVEAQVLLKMVQVLEAPVMMRDAAWFQQMTVGPGVQLTMVGPGDPMMMGVLALMKTRAQCLKKMGVLLRMGGLGVRVMMKVLPGKG